MCVVSVLVSKHYCRYRYQTDTDGIGRYRVPDANIGLTLLVTGMLEIGIKFQSFYILMFIVHTAAFIRNNIFGIIELIYNEYLTIV